MDDLDFEKLKASVAEQTGAQMVKPKTCRSTHSSNLSAEPT